MDVQDITGPLAPEKLIRFKPEPHRDEGLVARLVENVTDAQSG